MSPLSTSSFLRVLQGGGRAGAALAAADGAHPLGSPDQWPATLRVALSLMLPSPAPMCLWWGREGYHFYNDAFGALMGNAPPSPGAPTTILWTTGEPLQQLRNEVAAHQRLVHEAQPLALHRHGYPELLYFTFSYSPLRDELETTGLFCTGSEVTNAVLQQRRLATLTAIGTGVSRFGTAEEIAAAALEALVQPGADVPFAAVYAAQGSERHLRLLVATGADAAALRLPTHISSGAGEARHWALHRIFEAETALLLPLDEAVRTAAPQSAQGRAPTHCFVQPVGESDGRITAVLITALSPHAAWNDEYRFFLQSAGAALRNAMLEHQRLQEQLLQTERTWKLALGTMQSVFAQAPAAIVVMRGPEHSIELANEQALRSLQRSLPEIQGRPIAELYPSFEGQGITDLLNAVYNTGQRYTASEMPLHLDGAGGGQTLYVSLVYEALRNEWGSITGVISVSQDVTESVAMRRRSQESERRMSDVVAHLAAGVARCDATGRYLEVNERFEELTAYTRADLLTRSIQDLTHPDDWFANRRAMQASREGGKNATLEKRLLRADGSVSWVSHSLNWVTPRDGSEPFFAIVNTDISARKGLEERLYQSESRFRALIENNHDVIALATAEGQFEYISPSMGVMLGWAEHEMLSHPVAGFVHPEDAETIALRSAAIEAPGASTVYVVRMLHKGGDWCWIESRVTNLLHLPHIQAFVYNLHDVTQQREAQQTLEYRKALLEAQNETIPDGLLIVDTEGSILSYNSHFGRMWGIPQSIIDARNDAAALQHAMTMLVDPQGFIDRVAYLYAHPEEVGHEEVQFKDGRLFDRWGRAVVGADGRQYGWSWYFRDITEQRRAEAAIRESEENFRNLADTISQFAWMTDETGWIYWYNQRWYDYTGTTFEEMQGWGWTKVHHPDHADRIVASFGKAVQAGEVWEDIFPLRNKDGSFGWFLSRARPLRDEGGKIVRWFGTNTDITAQRNTELALRESQEKFRTLADALPQLIWSTDAAGGQEFVSAAWQRFTGQPQLNAEVWVSIVHPDDLHPIADRWNESKTTGQPYRGEVRLRNATGEYRWHQVYGDPVRNEGGEIIQWVGAFTDIHEQKTFAVELERRVAERTAELRRSNEDLDQFAHVASHDLKEPVRKMRIFGDRLRQEFGHLLPEAALGYLERMEKASIRMYDMIEGVLSYSSLKAATLIPEPVDLNAIIGSIEGDLEVLLQQKGAGIEREALPEIEGSPLLIYQLFYNLVVNSLKFSQPERPPVVRIHHCTDAIPPPPLADAGGAGFVCLQVHDNGIGFEPAYAERIFKTFTRLNAKDKYEGTGLGLALCKKIVERHGGAISATGEEGVGATFTIWLPRAGEAG